MSIDVSRPVADLVTAHPELAAVLQRHRIDFCCRGARPLRDWCADRGLDTAVVARELDAAIAARVPTDDDPRALSTPALAQHIVTRHHGYLREALPFLVPLAAKVARVHGDRDLRLVELRTIVEELDASLRPHLEREELELFSMIARGDRVPQHELDAMREEHLGVGALLERMREAARDYVVPEGACRSWTTLLRELETLERDVLIHVHLENHVLAPRLESEAS
ncbi:DUF542 domain-containing protein [Sandaracinus amylolyticus]|nr:DUF542 domain-containing protein [Sandaracinus amylolyticus]